MKNFKKVLALVLVVAMALTMVTIASAKFTDGETITKAEAVDVLSAIGVINGYDDGSFKPTGDVTRAEMAKMIATILNKGEDVGETYKGACTFADTASHWAAGYVAFCAQEKIIAGKSATAFKPDDKVTGTEAAKMLLCALGYNPEVKGLVGAAWASNTLSLARRAENNLLENIDGTLSANLNRENAAQMMLNALQANLVDFDITSAGYTINGITYGVQGDHNYRTCTANGYGTFLTNTPTRTIAALADAFGTLRKTITIDAAGRSISSWAYKNEAIGDYSADPYLTYTGEVLGGTLYADLGKLNIESANNVLASVYVDGALVEHNYNIVDDAGNVTDPATATAINSGTNLAAIHSGDFNVIGSNGAKIEVYYDTTVATPILNIVIINTYLGTVSQVVDAVKTAAGDLQTPAYIKVNTNNAVPVGTNPRTFSNGAAGLYNDCYETDEYTRADQANHTKVAYTIGVRRDNGDLIITSVAKATTVSGDVTTYAQDGANTVSITVGGQEYKVNANVVGTIGAPAIPSSATLYLDPMGFILASDVVESGNYAYVLAGVELTDEVYGTASYKVMLLKTDGSTEYVALDAYYIGAAQQTLNQTLVENTMKNCVFSYTVNATTGAYTLYQNAATMADLGATTTVNFTGTPTITGLTVTQPTAGAVGVVMNANTKFIIGVYDTNATATSYTVYDGLTKAPTFNVARDYAGKGYNGLSAVTDASGNALYVFAPDVELTATASTSSLMVIYKCTTAANGSYSADAKTFDATYTNNVEGCYSKVRAVVDGEVKELKMTGLAYNALNANQFNVIKTSKVDANGTYTEFTPVTASDNVNSYLLSEAITAWGDYDTGVVTINNVKKAIDGATPVFVFNKLDGKLTKTDVATFYADTNFDAAAGGSYFVRDSAAAALDKDTISALYMIVTR